MKRKIKIILDVIMLLMLLTLFSKQFISMAYHEIAGLILLALAVVHIALNIKTVTAMCKKFVKVPAAVKTGLVVDILMLICFVLLGVSGVLISHTILTGISSENVIFKQLHMFAGGASVILLGIHIGLHICHKPIPVAAAVIVTVIALCAGIYGVAASSEVRWLTSPFTASSQQGREGASGERGDFVPGEGDFKRDGGENAPGEGGFDRDGEGKARGEGEFDRGDRENMPVRGEAGQSGGGKNRQPLSPLQKLQSVVMFLGMILSCTMITYWIASPKKKKQEKSE